MSFRRRRHGRRFRRFGRTVILGKLVARNLAILTALLSTALTVSACLPIGPAISPNPATWTASIDNQTSRTLIITGENGGRSYSVATVEPEHDAAVEHILITNDGCSTYELKAHDQETDDLVAQRGPMCTGETWTIHE